MQIYINFDRYEIEGYMYLKNRSAIEVQNTILAMLKL